MSEKNNLENPISGFITRHSKASKEGVPDEKYKSLTFEGVDLAKERARQIQDFIDQAPANAVIFIGGASDQPRTKDTGEIYGNELHQIQADLEGKKDMMVITKSDIVDSKAGGVTGSLENVEKTISQNPDKKIIVDFPMQIRGFSYGYRDKNELGNTGEPRWINSETKKASDFFKKLLEDNNNDNNAAGRAWMQSWGEYQGLKGPRPIDVAKQYFEGFSRLQDFAKKHTDRPVVIGGVGHSWDVDAFATWMALGCPNEVDKDTFYDKFMEISQGGNIIKETELVEFKIEGGQITLKYRDQEYKQ